MANMLIVTEGPRSTVSPSIAKGIIEDINKHFVWFAGTVEIVTPLRTLA